MNGLFGSAVLDTAIGLVFIYLLFAIFCTTANEWIAGVLGTRGKFLQEGIQRLLADPSGAKDLLSNFYAHPMISGMIRGADHPSYISSRTFARVVIDLVTPTVKGPLTFEDLLKGIDNLPDGTIKKALLSLIQDAQGDLGQAQKNIEGWFDDAMDRVTGWYKRNTQIWTIVVASLFTVIANADTLNMSYRLWTDPAVRNAVVEEAKERAKLPPPTAQAENKDATNTVKPTVVSQANLISEQDRNLVGKLIGWSESSWSVDPALWLERIIGWLLTIIAISLGAPFWFDTLNKFMNIRNAGESPNEASKTPEKPKAPPANIVA